MDDQRIEIAELLRHATFIQGFARALTRDANLAEDVEQDTWLAVLRRGPERGSNARAWLAVVARRFLMRTRRAAERRERLRAAARTPAPSVEASDELVRREIFERLTRAVRELAEPYQSTILMHFYEGLPPRRIAERQGVPVTTVKSRIHRGVIEMRRALDAAYDGDRGRWLSAIAPLAARPITVALFSGAVMGMKIKFACAAVAILGLAAAYAWMHREDGDIAGGSPSAAERVSSTPRRRLPSAPGGAAPDSAMADDAAPVGRTIHGIVVDEVDRPIEGALVRAHPSSNGCFETVDLDAPIAACTARTDRSGAFSAPIDGESAVFDLVAIAPTGASGSCERVVASGADRRIVVGRTFRIAGTVFDLNAAPLPGVELSLESREGSHVVRRSARSDAEGRYAFAAVSAGPAMRGHPLLVVARGRGRATQSILVVRPWDLYSEHPATVDLDIYLARETRIAGLITDAASGAPVGDAAVRFWATDAAGSGSARRLVSESLSNANGRYEIGGVPFSGEHIRLFNTFAIDGKTGAGWLEVSAPGRARVWRPVAAAVVEGSAVTEDVEMVPEFAAKGRVTDAEGRGLALVRVGVSLYDAGPADRSLIDAEPAYAAVTDADGQYRIAAVPSSGRGPCSVRIGCFDNEGMDPLVSAAAATGESVTLPDLLLPDDWGGGVWSATVTDTEGRPVVGAVVKAGMESGFTDDRGAFELRLPLRLRRLQGRSASIEATGFRKLTVVLDDSLAGLPRKSYALERRSGRVIAGVVRDRDGAPISGAVVRALDGSKEIAVVDRPGMSNVRTGEIGFAFSGADGKFEIADLLVERTHLVVRWPDERAKRDGPPDAYVENIATDAKDVALVLRGVARASAAAVVVRVRDADSGAPVRRDLHAVLLSGGHPRFGEGASGPGLVRFAEVPPGAYTLRILADGYRSGADYPLNVVPGGPVETTVALTPGLVIEGRVVMDDGASVSRSVNVVARRRGGGRGDTYEVSTVDGAFRFDRLVPGDWILTTGIGTSANRAAEPVIVTLDQRRSRAETVLTLVPGGVFAICFATPEFRAASLEPRSGLHSVTDAQNAAAALLAARFHVRIENDADVVLFDGAPDPGSVLEWYSPRLSVAAPAGRYTAVIMDGDKEIRRGTGSPPMSIVIPIE